MEEHDARTAAATTLQRLERGRSMRAHVKETHQSLSNVEKAQRIEATILTRKLIIFFLEADELSDRRIDFDQFVKALPSGVREKHEPREIQAWFNLMDHDRDKIVTLTEAVLCAISLASFLSGAGILEILQQYDDNGSGRLSEREFAHAARELGFGDEANHVFHSLPLRADQNIDYVDLLEDAKLTSQDKKIAIRFITAMSWSGRGAHAPPDVDTRGWSFTGEDVESARTNLRTLLNAHRVKLSEVFDIIDTSDDQRVSREEFVVSFHNVLGFQGRREITEEIFAALDEFDRGVVTFDSLNGWLKGTGVNHRSQIVAAKQLSIAPTCVCAEEPPWDTSRLRKELQKLLDDAGLQIADLFDAWDDDCNGDLRKKEWLVHFKKLTLRGGISEELWYSKIRNAVNDAYAEIEKGRAMRRKVPGIALVIDGIVELGDLDMWLQGLAGKPSKKRRASNDSISLPTLEGKAPVGKERGIAQFNDERGEQHDQLKKLEREWTVGAPVRTSSKPMSKISKGKTQQRLPQSSSTHTLQGRVGPAGVHDVPQLKKLPSEADLAHLRQLLEVAKESGITSPEVQIAKARLANAERRREEASNVGKAPKNMRLPQISGLRGAAVSHFEAPPDDAEGPSPSRPSPSRKPDRQRSLHTRYQNFVIGRMFEARARARLMVSGTFT
jgi:Ca2+-binding EF-hand superfamily protein